jgi:hypothetical protein
MTAPTVYRGHDGRGHSRPVKAWSLKSRPAGVDAWSDSLRLGAIQDSTKRIVATLQDPLPRTVNGKGNQVKPPQPNPFPMGG